MPISIDGSGSITGVSSLSNPSEIIIGTGVTITSPSANELSIKTNGADRIRVSSDGSVGILTTNTNNRQLSVFGNGFNGTQIEVRATGSNSSGVSMYAGRNFEIQSTTSVEASYPNSFIVYDRSASAYRMAIDSSGRVLMPYQPCFQASGNQSTTYSSQVVPFNVSLTNNGSHYSTSTYRFTAPVAGYYFFTLHAILGPDPNGTALAHIRRNGSIIATIHRNTTAASSAWEQGACSAIVYLNVSDYADCFVGTGTIYCGSNVSGGDVYSAFNGHLIG